MSESVKPALERIAAKASKVLRRSMGDINSGANAARTAEKALALIYDLVDTLQEHWPALSPCVPSAPPASEAGLREAAQDVVDYERQTRYASNFYQLRQAIERLAVALDSPTQPEPVAGEPAMSVEECKRRLEALRPEYERMIADLEKQMELPPPSDPFWRTPFGVALTRTPTQPEPAIKTSPLPECAPPGVPIEICRGNHESQMLSPGVYRCRKCGAPTHWRPEPAPSEEAVTICPICGDRSDPNCPRHPAQSGGRCSLPVKPVDIAQADRERRLQVARDHWRKRFKEMQAALARTAESLRLMLRYQDKGYTWFAEQDRPEADAALEEARKLLGLTKENCFFVPGSELTDA
jgi:hypothetical protein